jgi:hypothetical protein
LELAIADGIAGTVEVGHAKTSGEISGMRSHKNYKSKNYCPGVVF